MCLWQSMAVNTRGTCHITQIESQVVIYRVTLQITYRRCTISRTLSLGFFSSWMTELFVKENFMDFANLDAFMNIFLYCFFSIHNWITKSQNSQTFSPEHCSNWHIVQVFFCEQFPIYGIPYLSNYKWQDKYEWACKINHASTQEVKLALS